MNEPEYRARNDIKNDSPSLTYFKGYFKHIKKIVQFSQGLLGKAFLVSENISLLEEYKESYNRFYEFCNSALSNRLNISQKLSTRFRTDLNGIYQELNNWMNFCNLIIKKCFSILN